MRRYPSAKDLARITKPGRYAVGHGAYLQIAKVGTRSWLFRYRVGDTQHHMGLGSCDYVTLAEARGAQPGPDPFPQCQSGGRYRVPSVEVRPRRSIAPVLKKVSVDLLTIAQPLGLRRREQWLLPVERLSDRHPLFRNGHSRQNSNYCSDFDRGSPMIRHDRLHPWRCDPRLGR
jgi:hypothetical protein